MIRAVADTNVLISAAIFGGAPEEVLDLAKAGVISLFTSKALLSEFERVLREKFHWPREDQELGRAQIERFAFCVEPRQQLRVILEDPADDKVLECALEAQSGFIITGDRHLLKLGSYERISILTPRQFLESIPWERQS